jgi:hypothetical protein
MPGWNPAPRQTTRRGHPCPDGGFASAEPRASLLLLHLYPVRTTPSRGGSRSQGLPGAVGQGHSSGRAAVLRSRRATVVGDGRRRIGLDSPG